MKNSYSNLHLIIAVIVLIPVAIAYGTASEKTYRLLFDFYPSTVDLKNIFRTLMALYLGIAALITVGIFNIKWWNKSSIISIVFFGSLACGRLLSFMLDGIASPSFRLGFLLELLITIYSFLSWKKFGLKKTSSIGDLLIKLSNRE
jgi:hypothetical protein